MKEWISAQGGDASYLEDTSKFPKAAHVIPIISERDGYISHMNAEQIGTTAAILGAGRASKEDTIDFAAGIILCKKTGDKVKRGDVMAYLHTNVEASIGAATERFISAISYSDAPVPDETLIHGIIR